MRVHELSKELGIPSKDIIARLTEAGIEVKSHMSAIPDEGLDLLTSSPAEEKAEAPVEEPAAPAAEEAPAEVEAPAAEEPAAEQEAPAADAEASGFYYVVFNEHNNGSVQAAYY